jgi:hypothetical protein
VDENDFAVIFFRQIFLPFGPKKKSGNFGFKKCKLGEFAVPWLNFAKLPISENLEKKTVFSNDLLEMSKFKKIIREGKLQKLVEI